MKSLQPDGDLVGFELLDMGTDLSGVSALHPGGGSLPAVLLVGRVQQEQEDSESEDLIPHPTSA